MLKLCLLVVLVPVLCLAITGGPLRQMFHHPKCIKTHGVDPGKPLFLTPLIESGEIEKAQKLSRVGQLPDGINITSHAGFLTVNKKYNSSMFFWFFPAMNAPKNAPVLLWLQGGPGGSSLFGLFVENGPLVVSKDQHLSLREFSWSSPFSVLYIDNPVGTGFSFTDSDDGYARNENDVANDLYVALRQFFTLFPDLQKNDFYVTGESYAGKYVPAIAYKIHQEKPSEIRLKGLAIGDGLIDPESMFDYGDFLYNIGLLDELQRDYMKMKEDMARDYIRQKEWRKAFLIFDELLNGDKITVPSFYKNCTGMSNYFNYLYTEAPVDQGYYNSFVTKTSTRKAIHVGSLPYNSGSKVEDFLLDDIMQSVKPWLATLMDNYKVMIYSGQLDVIVAYPLTANFLQTIKWKGAEEFKKAERFIWKVAPSDIEVAGYVRQVGNFYQVLARNAGHMIPYDQPRVALDMITRFVYGKPFHNVH